MINGKDITLVRLGVELHFRDADITGTLDTVARIKRLAKKYQIQAENSCNGYGVVKGTRYYSGISYGQQPDEYAIREYGRNVKSAYTSANQEETVFDAEADCIKNRILAIIKGTQFTVTFQGDPRGWCVRLFIGKLDVSLLVH